MGVRVQPDSIGESACSSTSDHSSPAARRSVTATAGACHRARPARGHAGGVARFSAWRALALPLLLLLLMSAPRPLCPQAFAAAADSAASSDGSSSSSSSSGLDFYAKLVSTPARNWRDLAKAGPIPYYLWDDNVFSFDPFHHWLVNTTVHRRRVPRNYPLSYPCGVWVNHHYKVLIRYLLHGAPGAARRSARRRRAVMTRAGSLH